MAQDLMFLLKEITVLYGRRQNRFIQNANAKKMGQGFHDGDDCAPQSLLVWMEFSL